MKSEKLETNYSKPLQELSSLKKSTNRRLAAKGLLSLTAMVTSIALLALLHMTQILSINVGMIILSSFALVHLFKEYRQTNSFFKLSAQALSKAQ